MIVTKFSSTTPQSCDLIVGFTDDKKALSSSLKALDKDVKGYISHALKGSGVFEGKAKPTLTLSLPKGAAAAHLLLIGLGKAKEMGLLDAATLGGLLSKEIKQVKAGNIAVYCDVGTPMKDGEFAAYMAQGAELRSYQFTKYRPEKERKEADKKQTITFVEADLSAAKKIYTRLSAVAAGNKLARDLVNEAPNVLYPESYAKLIKKELEPLGVKIEIFDEKQLTKMGMGAILAVGMGSARPPRMVVMRWNGAETSKKKDKPLGFVGKGVTFDTGGISLKPGAGMDEMKMDMGGSAAVVGLMKSLALQKVKKEVVGIVGLAENMPSDRAYRPGDIVKSYAGKHIEVLNTDAEGRLVLVDCLTYMQQKYDPAMIVDLATLTGAMMVALAHEYTGVFVNDEKLWNGLNAAGSCTGEKVWRMPLDEAYRKDVESDIGDVRNLAKNGRYGGACTAAAFLEHFIDEGRAWAHMDIAGTAWVKSDGPLGPKGATGVGVRLLEDFVTHHS